jgi:predicted DNA-binding transcriptional regulator AlpA
MTDVRVVTITVGELEALVHGAVRRALDEKAATWTRVSDLAGEELTLRDVMALLHVRQRKTIWRWRRELAFPTPHKRGGLWLYDRRQVDEWRMQQAALGAGGGGVVPKGRRRKAGESRAALAAH